MNGRRRQREINTRSLSSPLRGLVATRDKLTYVSISFDPLGLTGDWVHAVANAN